MNFQLSGRSNEIDGQVDMKVVTGNEQEEKFKEALKTFIDAVKDIYGNVSLVSVYGNGTVDHGGASLDMNMTVTNYQDDKLDAQGQPLDTQATADK